VEQCTLIGHSMGGYIALAFAEKYPQIVTGLVMFHSTAYSDSEERKEIRMKHIEFLESHGLDLFLRSFVPNLFSEEFVERYPDVIEKQRKEAQRIDVSGFISAIRAMRTRPNRLAVLQQAVYPVGYIIGKKDKAVPLADALSQLATLTNPKVLLLDDVGHSGMLEAPDECLAFLRMFLRAI
jgi:pimeloyl-ACP methyl ester carboxylesterase